jgi:UPF0716 family protein affecting phage T7 exclusion
MKEDEEIKPSHKSKKKKSTVGNDQKEKTTDEKQDFSENEKRRENENDPLSKGIDMGIGTLGGILLIAVGGPIGILLGVALLLAIHRKTVSKAVKRTYNAIAKHIKRRKNKKNEKKKLKNTKKETVNISKESLKKMRTRDRSVSKTNVLPERFSKSTSNKTNVASVNFDNFRKPIETLNKEAFKRKNTFPNRTKVSKNSEQTRPNINKRR